MADVKKMVESAMSSKNIFVSGFFGWNNIKKVITEIVNIYSNKDSFFSKKRIESGIAFIIAQFGMIMFLIEHISTMGSSDLAIWTGIEFAVSGYMINQIQKEKSADDSADPKA